MQITETAFLVYTWGEIYNQQNFKTTEILNSYQNLFPYSYV